MFVDREGRPVQVDEALAQDEFVQGNIGLRSDAKVPMFSPSGQMIEIPSENAYKAIESGFRFRSQIETDELIKRTELGDSPVLAGLAGAARGVSFGLSDVALTSTGIAEPETLRILKEENEISSAAGEFLGILGSFATGTGAVGAAARTAGTAVRGAGLAGAAAARATARLGAGSAAQMASRAGVEATLFGAGQIISESALEQTELTAETIASRLTGDAIMGMAFGAGFSLAGRATGATYNATKSKIDSLATKGMTKLKTQMDNGNIKKGLTRTLSAVTDVPEDLINRYKASADRVDALRSKGATVETVADDILEKFKNLDQYKFDLIEKQAEALTGSTNNVSAAFLKGQGTKLLNKYKASQAGGRLDKDMASAIRNLENMNNSLDLIAQGKKTIDLRTLHQFRIGIDRDAQRIFRKEAFQRTDAEKALMQFRATVDKTLKNKAGPEFRQVTERLAEAINTENTMRKVFSTENSNIYYSRLKRLAKNPSASRNEVAALEKFSEVTGENVLETLLDAGTNELLDAALTRGSKRVNLFGIVGLAAGGLPGAVAGGLGGAALDRYGGNVIRKAIRQIDNVQSLQIMQQEQQRMSREISTSVRGFLNKANQPVRSAIINQGVSSDLMDIDFSVIQEAIINMSTPAAIEAVESTYKSLEDAAPMISGMAAETTLKAAQFLNEKLPRSRTAMGMESAPSVHDQLRFKRYMTAVIDPESTLKQMAEGYVPTEGAETLRRVYPEIYNQIRADLVDEMAKQAPKLSYQRLAYLNQVFGLTRMPALQMPQEENQLQPTAFRTKAPLRAQTDVDRISKGLT
jgi:hypothetical protein